MSIRSLKKKLLRAIGRFLQQCADYLIGIAADAEDAADGPPKDWLDRVRAAGPIMTHSSGTSLERSIRRLSNVPAKLPGRITARRAQDAISLEDDFDPIEEGEEVPESIEPIEPPSNLPDVRLQKWRRPLRLRPTKYVASRFQSTVLQRREFQEASENVSTERAGIRGKKRESPAFMNTRFGYDLARISPENLIAGFRPRSVSDTPIPERRQKPATTFREVSFDVMRSWSAQPKMSVWPELPAAEFPNVPANYSKAGRASASTVEFAQPVASSQIHQSESAVESTESFESVPVKWPEPANVQWPELPDDVLCGEDAEVRAGRALEHRIRLDREQSGMTWSGRLF